MEKMISCCGLACHECDALLATKNNDDKKRAEVADLWSKMYNANLKPQDINCDGCLAETGRHIGHWNECEIRKCVKEKALKNCAYCDDYVCDMLQKFFQMAPDARKRLDQIRSSR